MFSRNTRSQTTSDHSSTDIGLAKQHRIGAHFLGSCLYCASVKLTVSSGSLCMWSIWPEDRVKCASLLRQKPFLDFGFMHMHNMHTINGCSAAAVCQVLPAGITQTGFSEWFARLFRLASRSPWQPSRLSLDNHAKGADSCQDLNHPWRHPWPRSC